MDEFKEQVKKSFTACKDDISELKNTVSNLEKENLNLKSQVSSLNENIIELKGELKGVKLALDYIKEFKTEQTEKKELIPQTISIPQEVKTVEMKTPQKAPEMFKDPYEALLAFKARNNKREVLKQKMMSMVGENGMNLSELKFMIVEHFKFCSKASFYNYLKELEIENSVTIRRENAKNTVYMNTLQTQH